MKDLKEQDKAELEAGARIASASPMDAFFLEVLASLESMPGKKPLQKEAGQVYGNGDGITGDEGIENEYSTGLGPVRARK